MTEGSASGVLMALASRRPIILLICVLIIATVPQIHERLPVGMRLDGLWHDPRPKQPPVLCVEGCLILLETNGRPVFWSAFPGER
jgi:hypothetical protein